MDPFLFRLIKINAAEIIEAQTAHPKRKMIESSLQPLSETVNKREETNFQLMVQRNLRVERQISQIGAEECARLNQVVVDQAAFFARRIDSLESALGRRKGTEPPNYECC